jgi:hypothetical protein
MGLKLDPTMIILFVIGAIIALTALSVMLSGDSVGDYYDANVGLENNANVTPLFTLVALFVPVGIILAVLVYFFKIK